MLSLIHAVDDGTDWNFYAQDGLGSVRAVLDDSAVVQSVMSYDPYGNPMGAYREGFGFTREQTNVSGQVFLRARYYEPSLGVFNALDPFEGVTDRAMSLNGYSWVEGNVPNWTDASGLAGGGETDCVTLEQALYAQGFRGESLNALLRDSNCSPATPTFAPTPTVTSTPVPPTVTVTPIPTITSTPSPTPMPTVTPMATLTCTPTLTPTPSPTMQAPPTPMPSATPTMQPTPSETSEARRVVFGVRFDASVTLDAMRNRGMDMNVEFQCGANLSNLDCGWFFTVSRENTFSLGMHSPRSFDSNLNLGFIIGYANWPEDPGEHTFVVTAGLSSGKVVGKLVPWRFPFETDLGISNAGDAIFFFGGGTNTDYYPSTYIGVGATVYIGRNIFDIGRVAFDKMVDLSRWLFDVEDMNDFRPE